MFQTLDTGVPSLDIRGHDRATVLVKPHSLYERLENQEVGTAGYMDPLMLKHDKFSPAADIYSFGARCWRRALRLRRADGAVAWSAKHWSASPSPLLSFLPRRYDCLRRRQRGHADGR